MLVALNILVLSMIFHTYLAYVVTKSKSDSVSLLGSSIFIRGKVNPSEDQDSGSNLKHARRLNLIAKVVFAIFGILFTIVFFCFAFNEYFRPAYLYIEDP